MKNIKIGILSILIAVGLSSCFYGGGYGYRYGYNYGYRPYNYYSYRYARPVHPRNQQYWNRSRHGRQYDRSYSYNHDRDRDRGRGSSRGGRRH